MLSNFVYVSKARLKRRTFYEPNVMQMRGKRISDEQELIFFAYLCLSSTHEKYVV